MTEPFEDAGLLIEEAQGKFDTLFEMMQTFVENKPSAYRAEIHRDADETWHMFRVIKTFPPRARSVMSGAIGDLRHALDIAVCESARLLGATKLDKTYFPFANSFDELEPAVRDKCKNVPPEIVVLIRTFKPYNGGDSDLHALTRLAGAGKHRELLKVSPKPRPGRQGKFNTHGVIELRYIFDIGSPRDDELLFAITTPASARITDIEMEIGHVLCFGDVAGMKGRVALDFLDDSIKKVTLIVAAIKAETLRLIATKLDA